MERPKLLEDILERIVKEEAESSLRQKANAMHLCKLKRSIYMPKQSRRL